MNIKKYSLISTGKRGYVRRAAFVYCDTLSRHVISETHPMKPERLRYTYDLLCSYEAFDGPTTILIEPGAANVNDLRSFHREEYISAVKSASSLGESALMQEFNLGFGDNPSYKGMYEAAILSVGASMSAVETLISEEADVAFNISGGLHHAMPSNAYGFCVFNDPVIAINELLKSGFRVAYLDIDCHHGDGVQGAFYDTDSVLTISIHESGKFLFPGTGEVNEVGNGRGRGYSVNVPLFPYTTDEIYSFVFRETAVPLLKAFDADVLVTQLGIDTHFKDPITHLALTTQGHENIVSLINDLEPSKWLALGGGGYHVASVANAWTLDYGIMSGQKFPNEIPNAYARLHNVDSLRDEMPIIDPHMLLEAKKFGEATVREIRKVIFPYHRIE